MGDSDSHVTLFMSVSNETTGSRMSASPSRNDPCSPDGALPCVWMTAGLVAFKLCSRGFDCDNCPLDMALRGACEPGATVTPTAPREFRADRSYHRTHTWLLPTESGRMRYGVDGFAARLLDRVTGVVFPTVNSTLRPGRPACWLSDDGHPVTLLSPIGGTVTAVNDKVRRNPALISQSPYDAGWLLDMSSDADLHDESNLVSADVMRKRTEFELEQLHRDAALLLSQDAIVGPTLADGGEPLADLREMLGVVRYHRIIGQFLG